MKRVYMNYLAYVLNPELVDLGKSIEEVMVEGGCVKSGIIEKKGLGGKYWRLEVVGIFDKDLGDLDLVKGKIKELMQLCCLEGFWGVN